MVTVTPWPLVNDFLGNYLSIAEGHDPNLNDHRTPSVCSPPPPSLVTTHLSSSAAII
jgi:hypothetical protein